MKRTLVILLAAVAFGTAAHQSVSATPAVTDVQFRYGFFYSSLSAHGEWIEIEPDFVVWRPHRVHYDWRPYLEGRWAWTDYGWYWVSYEPFGYITYHYGRWYYDDYYGWYWVPDDVWGPAWVEWRYSDDYVGWAPLPPYASFSITVGIRFTTRWHAPHHYWTFLHCRDFGTEHGHRHALSSIHVRRIFGHTRIVGRYEVERNNIINRGVDREAIERRGYTRISRVDVTDVPTRGERMTRGDGRERIEVYRPSRSDMEQRPDRAQVMRGQQRSSLDVQRVERTPSRGDGTTRDSGPDRQPQATPDRTSQPRQPEATRQPDATRQPETPQRTEQQQQPSRPQSTPEHRQSTPTERRERESTSRTTPSERRQEQSQPRMERPRQQESRPAPARRESRETPKERDGGRRR